MNISEKSVGLLGLMSVVAIILVLLIFGFLAAAMIGSAMRLWSMPVTHRIVFGIVFGWTAITSIELIRNSNRASEHTHQPPYS